tara:strand:+ start:114 stop:1028 length:915 start_codon:yes stop_codon:yes gene_type:complete
MNEINIEYKDQYLKYKKKYLDLKDKIGGYGPKTDAIKKQAEAAKSQQEIERLQREKNKNDKRALRAKIAEENMKVLQNAVLIIIATGLGRNSRDSFPIFPNLLTGGIFGALTTLTEGLLLPGFEELAKEKFDDAREPSILNTDTMSFMEEFVTEYLPLLRLQMKNDLEIDEKIISNDFTLRLYTSKDAVKYSDNVTSRKYQLPILKDKRNSVEIKIGDTTLYDAIANNSRDIVNSYRDENGELDPDEKIIIVLEIERVEGHDEIVPINNLPEYGYFKETQEIDPDDTLLATEGGYSDSFNPIIS